MTVDDRPVRSGCAGDVEDHIRKAFAACFKVADVGLDDDFFALGGDSLRAARVLERIASTLHVRLEPESFFRAPTPRLIASAVMLRRAGDSPSASASLVPLSAGAGGTPVYLVHGVTPRPWMFRSLVPALRIDRPIYGTSSPEMQWEREVLTIEEMGAHYAAEIKRVQPRGPYSLVGYSLGGIVAFAIAERLRRDGEHISHLVLLDTTPPPRFPWAPGWSRFAIAALLRWLAQHGLLTHAFVRCVPLKTSAGTLTRPIGRVRLAFGSGPLTARELRAALQVAFPGYPRRRTKTMSFEALSAAIADELKRALSEEEWTKVVRMAGSEAPSTVIKSAKLSAKNKLAARAYRPQSIYDGTITIYASEGNRIVNGWQRYTTQPLNIKRFPVTGLTRRGTHKAFIDPHNVVLYGADLGRFLESDNGETARLRGAKADTRRPTSEQIVGS